jgi:nucleoside diphosphate kinase
MFILIKPDAVMRGLVGKILTKFEERGFWINSLVTRFKNEESLKEIFSGIYEEDECLEYLGSPLVGFILSCQYPSDRQRIEKIVGSFLRPELCEVGSIREQFGITRVNNAVGMFLDTNRINAFYDPKTDRDPRNETNRIQD